MDRPEFSQPESERPAFRLTILESTGQPINKQVELKPDGTLEKQGYQSAYLFKRELSAPINTIEELAAELERIQSDPYRCIVMGKPCGPMPLEQAVRRLKHADQETGDPATLEDQAVAILPLDVDKMVIPDLDVIGDPETAVETATQRLGPEFENVSCWWQLTSSQEPTGNKLRLRLFFILNQSLELSELKRWGRAQELVDPSIYQAAQPIYTATPTFTTGRDHLPRRSGLLLREHDTVTLAISEQASVSGYARGDASGTVKGAEGYLAKIGDHPGGNGFHNAITPAIMSLVNHQWPDANTEGIKATIRQRIQETDQSNHTPSDIAHRQADSYLDPSIRDAIRKVEGGLRTKYPDQSIEQIAEHIRQYRKNPPREAAPVKGYDDDINSGRYEPPKPSKANGKDSQAPKNAKPKSHGKASLEAEQPTAEDNPRVQQFKASMINGAELNRKEFPDVRWAIPKLLPEGVAILAGPPKVGKSWMALNMALAVAMGGKALSTIEVEEGDVLYCALEDNHRRLKRRLNGLLTAEDNPERLTFTTRAPRLDDGLVGAVDEWLTNHPQARLVILDTLAKIRPGSDSRSDRYSLDYAVGEQLTGIAQKHGVAILLIHHTRKSESEDPVDLISGTLGLSGGVDGLMVLKRGRAGADGFLYVTGRDIEEEKSYAVNFDSKTCLWKLMGDAAEFEISKERKEILDLLGEGEMRAVEVAKALGKAESTTRTNLRRMADDGLVRKGMDGKYRASTGGVFHDDVEVL